VLHRVFEFRSGGAMSSFAQVLALLPAVAAIAVIVVAFADRCDTARLNGLRDLDAGLVATDEPLESSAA
jgi:hypothetical protein